MLIRRLTLVFVPLLMAVASRGQGPALHPLPGVATTVIVVTFAHGLDHDEPDESGLAGVLLECRQQRALARVAAVQASGVHVGNDAGQVFVQVAAKDWQRAVAFVAALLDDATPLADDTVRLVVARAALRADDATWLYPGPVLRGMARRALCVGGAGRGEGGSAQALQQLTPAGVDERLRRAVAVEIAAFGSIPDGLAEALGGLVRPGRPQSQPQPVRFAAPPAAGIEIVRHRRVDAAIVAVAFPVPAAQQSAALAVGLEVARMRANRRFGAGGELSAAHGLARAPFVHWSWLEADPVVSFTRRGSGSAAVPAVRDQLESLLADLRRREPSAAELERAKRAISGELSPLPWPGEVSAAIVRAPAALAGRAMAAVRAERRGIGRAAIAAVTAAAAHTALLQVLDPASAWAGALVPHGGNRP
ncbi:MAG: hypothetical protein KDC98_11825 [Planctomycetes bacterium]|nr:hypothetical protein [Planctomycetota bacterium]